MDRNRERDRDRLNMPIVADSVFNRQVSNVRTNQLSLEQLRVLAELNAPADRQPENFVGQSQSTTPGRQVLTQEDVERIAFYDDLTPVYNFRYLLRKLDREVRRSKRYNRPLSIMIVAIGGLQKIQAEFGDQIHLNTLIFVANQLNAASRTDIDMVARYGDDRFLLMLPETPGSGAVIVADRIRKKFLDLPFQHNWHKLWVETSIGIAYFPAHGTAPQELIAKADLACDLVVERGGNGTAFCP